MRGVSPRPEPDSSTPTANAIKGVARCEREGATVAENEEREDRSDVDRPGGDDVNVGVCLSGGGHRATAWGIGVLSAVVDARLHRRTVSIGSVSGGSIASAAVAAAGDFRQVDDAAELADWVSPTLRVVAVDGLFLPGRPTRRYVRMTLAALVIWAALVLAVLTTIGAVERGHPWWPYGVAGAVVGALGGLFVSRTITHRLVPSIVFGAVLGGAVSSLTAGVVADLLGRAALAAIVAVTVLAVLTGVIATKALGKRGDAVAQALSQQFDAPGEPPKLLREVRSGVNHVFCTTDVESGEAMFFAPEFVYGFRRGIAHTASCDLTIGQVTQASAAVPPGFSPVSLPVPEFRHADLAGNLTTTAAGTAHVSDGGVYDNLGEQWESGFDSRVRRYPSFREVQEPADLLIVADASPRFGWKRFEADGTVHRELVGVERNVEVMWAATTTRRRHDLYEAFVHREIDRAGGTLVMIDNSPIYVCDAAAQHHDPAVVERAHLARRFLLDQRDADKWADLTARCSQVATTLGPLTTSTTIELLEHGYVSTTVLLHVFLGRGELRAFPAEAFEGPLGA